MLRPLTAVSLLVFLLGACAKEEKITAPFVDNFDRQETGSAYHNTGGPYQIVSGKLNIRGAYNHPLWLKKKLPRDAQIEFDVVSKTPDGDIKVEVWGDGQTFAEDKGAYLASSYVFIFGGWNNSTSAICRMDEHAPDRITRSDVKVEPGRSYHFLIRRKGNLVEWIIDGKQFLSMNDPNPLQGDNHSYFGFNNWASDLDFSNLKITPL